MRTITDSVQDPRCWGRHMGPWAIEPVWFRTAVAAYKATQVEPVAAHNQDRALFTVGQDGIARIDMVGPMMKGDSKFGGANTLAIRRAIRAAANDSDVRAIILHIDSPGGTVAGTADLAADVRDVNAIKPVFAHIDDLGASAAFWVASQATRITANATAEIGSIGTMAVLHDTSEAMSKDGIQVHVISTGEFKGAFTDGTEVTDAHLSYAQGIVDDLNAHFLSAVGKRPLTVPIGQVADGRTFIAEKAVGLGLIDAVGSFDDAIGFVVDQMAASDRLAAAEHRQAENLRKLD